jgi:hypothetical protein
MDQHLREPLSEPKEESERVKKGRGSIGHEVTRPFARPWRCRVATCTLMVKSYEPLDFNIRNMWGV